MAKKESKPGRRVDTKKLLTEGTRRLRKRKPSRQTVTKKKVENFFIALADTCNVKLAAKTAGISTSTVYLRRQKDARFRGGWDSALVIGFDKLEMEMLKRALHGVERTVITRSGETHVIREYNDRLGLALLRMHRETAAAANEGVDQDELQEALDRIAARIERLREHKPREDGGEGTEGPAVE